jgi:hypothetical protein
MKVWTVKRLIAAASESPNLRVRRSNERFDLPCQINRVTPKGRVMEGVTIYEDHTIHRNDIPLDHCVGLRPQDAARLFKLQKEV